MEKNLNNFGSARMTASNSNCKLSNVEYISNVWNAAMYDTPEEKLQRFRNFFAQGKTVISLNTIITPLKDFLVKNFNVHSVIEVPVGYSTTPQYHIILNNNKGYWKTTVPKDPNVGKLEETITKILKAKRRKTDIVKDIMAGING